MEMREHQGPVDPQALLDSVAQMAGGATLVMMDMMDPEVDREIKVSQASRATRATLGQLGTRVIEVLTVLLEQMEQMEDQGTQDRRDLKDHLGMMVQRVTEEIEDLLDLQDLRAIREISVFQAPLVDWVPQVQREPQVVPEKQGPVVNLDVTESREELAHLVKMEQTADKDPQGPQVCRAPLGDQV